MAFIQAVVLGMVQGATEFLPISSSGHLVIVPALLHWNPAFLSGPGGLAFDVFLHLGTLVAAAIYFRAEVWKLTSGFISTIVNRSLEDPFGRLAWVIALATLPAAAAAAALEEFVEAMFQSALAAGGLLIVTGFVLLGAERVASRWEPDRHLVELRWRDGLAVGLAQVLALAPGISRSGVTISAGVVRGVRRRAAARFSFLMSIPIIAGASLKKGLDVYRLGITTEHGLIVLAGGISAAIVGYLSIRYLLGYLERGRLDVFAYYCWAVGAATVVGVLIGFVR